MIEWAKRENNDGEYEEAYIHGYKCAVWAADGEWWINVTNPDSEFTSWGDGYESCAEAQRAAEEHVSQMLAR